MDPEKKEQTKETPAFLDTLPENLRGHEDLKQFNSVEDLANNFIDRGKHIGQSIRIPSAEAGEEDWAAFTEKLQKRVPNLMPTPDLENEESVNQVLNKLGRPADAESYEVPEVEGIELQPEEIRSLREHAHKLGWTKKQFRDFTTQALTDRKAAADATMAEKTQALDALKEEWGETFDARKENVEAFLLQYDAPESLIEAVKNDQFDLNALRFMHTLVKTFVEDADLAGQGKEGPRGDLVDPVEAGERATELRNKITKGEIQKSDPNYKAVLARISKYDQMAKAAQ